MKKLLLFLLLLTQIAFGQINTSTVKAGKYQMNIPENGAKKDSAVVWDGVTKLLKILPVSEIKGTTNLDFLATPTGGTVFSSTGTDAVLPLATATNAGLQSPVDKSKLDGIANGATANQTDAYLLSRTNHTGTQPISTVTGLQTTLDGKVDKVAGERLINASEITKLSNQSGINTGDQDLSNLVVKNTAITGATNTKITYDSKGLVTGGTSLVASDVPTLNQNTTGTASTITGSIAESQVTGLVTDLSNKQSVSQKNTANGYAGLGGDGKLISSQLPSITISDTFVTASQATMLALTAETGDVAVRTDLNKSFILKGTNPTVLADWQELLTPTSAVTTVFGRNGAVTAQTGDYTATMVGAPSGSGTSTGTNTGDNAINSLYSSLVSNATHTGDATGSTALTLATVNSNVGSFSNASITVNAKGLVTAISSGATPVITETDPTVPAYSKSLTAFSVIKPSTDALYEPTIITKNTAFNKNFGTVAGTVAEGNDSRVMNGQTAFNWGNHSGLYPTYNGTGAAGTWNIGITGNAATVSRLRNFGSQANANNLTGGGSLWFYGQPDARSNIPAGQQYGSVFQFNSQDDDALALQIANGINHNSTNSTAGLYFRSKNNLAWQNDWKTVLHDGNFNTYSPTLAGTGASGTWGISINGTAATADRFSGIGYEGYLVNPATYFMAYNATTSKFGVINQNDARAFLGLGSNAYNSTAYLPLTGGTVTGEIESTYRFKLPGMYIGYWDGINNRIENVTRPLLFTSYGSGNNIKFGFDGLDDAFVLYQATNGIKMKALAGTGTRTVVADASGNLSAITTTDSRPYKVYTVLMYDNAGGFSQTVLENSLAGAISWVKTGTGLFEGTLPTTYTSTKIACFMGQTVWDGQLICYSDGVKVYLQTRDNNHALGQYKMTGTPLEIRVYN